MKPSLADRRRPGRRGAALTLALSAALLVSCSSTSAEQPADVEVFGPWLGADALAFDNVIRVFEEQSGLDVRYTGTASFAEAAVDRARQGDPPDVEIFPQPGLLQEMMDRGYLYPLSDDDGPKVTPDYSPVLQGIGGKTQRVDGVIFRLNVKSLVWYRPELFREYGYEVPDTLPGLYDLTRRMIRDGNTPWCLGVSAGRASGWPATDWVEDLVLRGSGTDTYDEWAAGGLPFTAKPIADAYQEFGDLLLTQGATAGSRRSILNTTPAGSTKELLADPPGCLMYRQASFISASLPKGTTVGPDGDVDVFVLPGVEADEPPPLLVGGDIAAAASDRPETYQFLQFLATPEAAAAWEEVGHFISPLRGYDPQTYGDTFDERMNELLRESPVVRFDGSDLMIPAVGSDSFYTSMLTYIGTSDLADSLAEAQEGYRLAEEDAP